MRIQERAEVKEKVWNEAENREREWSGTPKIRTVRFAYVIFVRITRFSQSWAISMAKFRCKLSSNVFNKSFAIFRTVKNRGADCLDLLVQELEFLLKSEQREALELLLGGEDVFCVLSTGFGKSLIYQVFVHARSSVQRPTVIVISPA